MLDLKANLAAANHFIPRDVNIATDGALTLTGSLKGTLKAIDPDLVVTVENGLILSPDLEPGFSKITMRARIENGEANVEQLTANWGTASLEASARLPLEVVPPLPVEIPRMGGPAVVKAAIKGLDPSALPGASARLGGTHQSRRGGLGGSSGPCGAQWHDHLPRARPRIRRFDACTATAVQHQHRIRWGDGGAAQPRGLRRHGEGDRPRRSRG